jgi:hypothetical protein
MDAVLPPESFDLIVSRGSLGFWGGPEEIRVALGNVWKLLAPGGKTYIGGGLGNAEVRAEIVEKMKVIQPDWPGCLKTNGISSAEYERIARGIDPGAAVTEDDSGRWILMAK